MADNISKTITLESIDGQQFEVPEAVAMQSRTMRCFMEDGCAAILIPNVHSTILAMVAEYCQKHTPVMETTSETPTKAETASDTSIKIEMASDTSTNTETAANTATKAETPKAMSPEEELKLWDAKFLDIDINMIFDLILAAEYLDISDLLNLTCEKAANMLKGKMPEEIRETFDVKDAFTSEEEKEIRLENAWTFDFGEEN